MSLRSSPMVSNWLAICANSSSASGSSRCLTARSGDGDLRLLALVVAAEQVGLEGGALAGGQGVECLVDSLDELAGADLVADVVGRVDLLAADGGDEVELGEVSGGGRTVDSDEGAEAGAEVLQLVLHLIRGHRDRLDLELQAVVVGQLELGAHVDLDGDEQVAGEVLLARPLGDVGLGASEGADLLLLGGLAVEAVEAFAHRVVEHLGASDALVDDGRRHLALAEAGDVHRLGDVLVRVIDGGLQLIGGDGDVELDARGRELLDGRRDHGGDSC